MPAWRMAFRCGKNGYELWPDYHRLGIATIEYSPVDGRGVRVLQVHHRQQLAARETPSITKLGDLVVCCANCHLLPHLDPKNALSVEKLREMVEADGFL